VIAVSDSKHTALNQQGIKIDEVMEAKKANTLSSLNDATIADSEAILSTKADILVLAALGGVITDENQADVQASIILELANGPVDESAHSALVERDVLVVPDIIANAGGVVVSFLEWQQNKANESWDEDRVNSLLAEYMRKATKAMFHVANEHNISLKEAAFEVALKQLDL
jgi:glutamate dehydrogenase/leucine dehydrogenase